MLKYAWFLIPSTGSEGGFLLDFVVVVVVVVFARARSGTSTPRTSRRSGRTIRPTGAHSEARRDFAWAQPRAAGCSRMQASRPPVLCSAGPPWYLYLARPVNWTEDPRNWISLAMEPMGAHGHLCAAVDAVPTWGIMRTWASCARGGRRWAYGWYKILVRFSAVDNLTHSHSTHAPVIAVDIGAFMHNVHYSAAMMKQCVPLSLRTACLPACLPACPP